ncbi:MAG TPA: acylphosphatase [Caulobacteraceae bacterium]|nr:acylphosphatase [Caulobacteraceae bacterium]
MSTARNAESLLVVGRVQGVGYRWWCVGAAQRLGLDGWVRNLTDGTVEILAIGAPAAIDALARECRTGPTGARVEDVERVAADDDGSRGFVEKATARAV